MYDTIIFDLDGTLTDSGPGIKNSVKYALNKYKVSLAEDRLTSFIGPPLVDSFMRECGFDKEKATEAVIIYREYYTTKGMFENSVYEGMEETLKTLKDEGKKLMVATAKPEVFAKQILEHFDLAKYFDFIGGALMNESRANKKEVLRYVIEENNINVKTALMVGDRKDDAGAAIGENMDILGVLFGYGTEEELTNAGVKMFASSPAEITEFVLSKQ